MLNRKGIALILAVSVLAILTIMATTFSLNMRLEYRAAKNYYNGIKARYLAEAAQQRAIAELRKEAQTNPFDDTEEVWAKNGFSDSIGSTASSTIIDNQRLIDVNKASERLLKNLISIQLPLYTAVQVDNLYNRIINRRAYNRLMELMTKLPASDQLTQAEFDALAPFLTVFSFYDVNAADRTPININTADLTVLKSVLRNVLTSQTEADNTALAIYNRVRGASANPFESWSEFNSFIDGLVPGTITASTQATLVKDNCNPNRTKPATYTTEFCFHSGGYYTITATGTATDALNNPLASRKLSTVVKIFDIYTETTKYQFAQGTPVRVTWLDSCPVNSSALFDSYSIPVNAQLIPNSIKLGYWDDFNSDAQGGDRAYTQNQWTTSAASLTFESGYGQAGRGDQLSTPSGTRCDLYVPMAIGRWNWTENFSLRLFANDFDSSSASLTKDVGWILFRNNGDIIPNAGQPAVMHTRNGTHPLTWDGSAYAYLIDAPTGSVLFYDVTEAMSTLGYPTVAEAIAGRHKYSPGEVRIFNSYVYSDNENWDNAGYGIDFGYSQAKTFKIKTNGTNVEATVYTTSGSSSTLSRNISCDRQDGRVALYGNSTSTTWDDLRIIPTSGTFTSRTIGSGLISVPASGVVWGTITWTVTKPDSVAVDVSFKRSIDGGTIWQPVSSPAIAGSSNSITYEATLTTTVADIEKTPVLEDVNITYLPGVKILSRSLSP